MLKRGIYEQVRNREISKEIDANNDIITKLEKIDQAESSTILAKYITEIIEKGLNQIHDNKDSVKNKIDLTNKIVNIIAEATGDEEIGDLSVDDRAEQLLAVLDSKDNINTIVKSTDIIRPETSISMTSLFTGSGHEPSMFTELKKEILSCDRIDMLVSFIKWSGLVKIIEELREFTQNGGKLRVITTSYMGATDLKAIEELRKLQNTQIRVSYDTKRTRLHAKTYVFYRDTGFTTAYVGSSNLSNAAISSGMEWNVKLTEKDSKQTIRKIEATLETYWNSYDFEEYQEESKEKLSLALEAERYYKDNNSMTFTFDVTPYPYQQEILDKLQTERVVRGSYKNLIVAATGTGKTVISAFDYKNYCSKNPGKANRLLFVTHREEILVQALNCFRGILKDNNFGELYVGRHRPSDVKHLFVSVQTFNSQDLWDKFSKDYYDYIIIDETHHAVSVSYQKIFDHFDPEILLGLTATPERMDGKSILDYFDNRIAAEIRLPEAIERKLLSPFQYFGVSDTVDLDTLKWAKGGYDKKALSELYTGYSSDEEGNIIKLENIVAQKRAELIVNSLDKYIADMRDVKGLGFCVTIAHAEYMAEYFNKRGISSISLTRNSSKEERETAKSRLISGEIKFIFVVDIYNEGVDIPEINTVLFLRPTESITIFLQQLGRGLRLAENKDCLTVLDFIGMANKKYNFADKLGSILSDRSRSIEKEIKDDFVSVPKGCYISLEKKAKEAILNNIRSTLGTTAGMVSKIISYSEDSEIPLTLKNFLNYYHINEKEVYRWGSFSRLCVRAGVKEDFDEELEPIMEKAFKRICHIDSRRWIAFLLDKLSDIDSLEISKLSQGELRLLEMTQFTIWQKSLEECGFADHKEALNIFKENPNMLAEFIELLKYRYEEIDFIDESTDLGFDCPLDVYCTYSRDQILVAMDYMKPATVREGVKYLEDKNTDIFFVTLNKSEKHYSPTTMYEDYSINNMLFHWQSQSTTSASSPTGQRYINHKARNSQVLLFVREQKTDMLGAMPYTFLGKAEYISHKGSKPMSIVWKLEKPTPAKYLKKTSVN